MRNMHVSCITFGLLLESMAGFHLGFLSRGWGKRDNSRVKGEGKDYCMFSIHEE